MNKPINYFSYYNTVQNKEIISFIEKVKQKYQLNQKEIICLGIVAQYKSIIATEFSKVIQSTDNKQIRNWLCKLLDYKIVLTRGKTKGLKYFINPQILKNTELEKTDLSNIEEHRLKNLILEDLEKYPYSNMESIHKRIGNEIPIRSLRRCIYTMVKESKIKTTGSKKFRKYFIDQNKG